MKCKQRNPNRLYNFYKELQDIHIANFPDIRFGQLISNITFWLETEKKTDIFYVEENKMTEFIKEYAEIYGNKTEL